MKIGICGHGRAGKDTAAEWLAKHTGLRYVAGTSYWARHLVFERMSGYGYDNADECWQDRHNYRKIWAKIIGEYNRRDPVQLYRDCLAEQDLLTGVRWLHEFKAIKESGLCDVWMFVHRPGIPVDPTCEITADDCDIAIRNDGTLDEFHEKLRRLAVDLGLSLKHAA